jgi:hypothetical protein
MCSALHTSLGLSPIFACLRRELCSTPLLSSSARPGLCAAVPVRSAAAPLDNSLCCLRCRVVLPSMRVPASGQAVLQRAGQICWRLEQEASSRRKAWISLPEKARESLLAPPWPRPSVCVQWRWPQRRQRRMRAGLCPPLPDAPSRSSLSIPRRAPVPTAPSLPTDDPSTQNNPIPDSRAFPGAAEACAPSAPWLTGRTRPAIRPTLLPGAPSSTQNAEMFARARVSTFLKSPSCEPPCLSSVPQAVSSSRVGARPTPRRVTVVSKPNKLAWL